MDVFFLAISKFTLEFIKKMARGHTTLIRHDSSYLGIVAFLRNRKRHGDFEINENSIVKIQCSKFVYFTETVA